MLPWYVASVSASVLAVVGFGLPLNLGLLLGVVFR